MLHQRSPGVLQPQAMPSLTDPLARKSCEKTVHILLQLACGNITVDWPSVRQAIMLTLRDQVPAPRIALSLGGLEVKGFNLSFEVDISCTSFWALA